MLFDEQGPAVELGVIELGVIESGAVESGVAESGVVESGACRYYVWSPVLQYHRGD